MKKTQNKRNPMSWKTNMPNAKGFWTPLEAIESGLAVKRGYARYVQSIGRKEKTYEK